MREKIAMPVREQESRECAVCHCFTQEGCILRDSQMVRFVCGECYESLKEEYPLSKRVVRLDRAELKRTLFPENRPGFHAGYLMGKRETADDGFCISVSSFLESVSPGRGTAHFFNQEDVLKIRSFSRETGTSVVGIFRTSPSGVPDFNSLDEKILDDLLLDIVYLITGGVSEIQTAVKYRPNREEEIGVIFS